MVGSHHAAEIVEHAVGADVLAAPPLNNGQEVRRLERSLYGDHHPSASVIAFVSDRHRSHAQLDYEASKGPMMMNAVAHVQHLQSIDGALAKISTSSDRQSGQMMEGPDTDSRTGDRSCH
jgi:hypothetical protein